MVCQMIHLHKTSGRNAISQICCTSYYLPTMQKVTLHLFQTSSDLITNFKCKAKLANESTPPNSVSLSLRFLLRVSRVPVAMVI